jgi:membrane-bound lytic murein transglycosylase A
MHAKTPARGVLASFVGAILCSTASAALAQEPLKLLGSQLEPIKWTELAGWSADDHLAAFEAFQASCRALRKNPHPGDDRPIQRALWNVCRRALDLHPQDSHSARALFEDNFHPVRIAPLGEAAGLLTGYFEPIVQGSSRPNSEFHVPVYRRPPDLVAVGYKPGTNAFPNKSARIGRRDEKGQLVPYYDRAAIEAGALEGQNLEICWLKNPSDLLTIQIQGSGRVILEDGTPLRISYDSFNGYSYASSSGGALNKPNQARRGKTSNQRRRTAPPDETAKAHAINRSYVFFRITGLSNDGEAIGAQGVPLTPGRSIAVDRLHDYGTPFFIEANLPIESAKHASAFQRLMIAQDTGSAIVGPARADLYLGAGDDAGHIARRIRHPGRFVMLIPRGLDMTAAGKQMPLPLPKPKFAEVEVRKHNGKGEADWAKSKVDSRAAAAYARGATGAHIDSKPPASPSAPRSAAVSKQVKQVEYQSTGITAHWAKSKVDSRAAAAYARGATGAHIDPKPPTSPSAPRSAAVSKQVKQVEYQSTGITVPSYIRNSRQAGNSTAHDKQVRLNSPSRGRTSTQNWVR